jgi:hypothetical protein
MLSASLAACAMRAAVVPITEPIAIARGNDVVITLSREPCALLPPTTNLPFRATWAEAGKLYDGCYGVQHGMLVVAYWSDGTVTTTHVFLFSAPASERPHPENRGKTSA